MSCSNNQCYLPQPPRAWSRVQNSCSLEVPTDNNALVRLPLTGQLVNAYEVSDYLQMLRKGNVLQYKANSGSLTRAQKYSKIAKGQWVNRNTTWAVQSAGKFNYTNSNMTSLRRANYVNLAINPLSGEIIGPTTDPLTCPQPINPFNPDIPIVGSGGSSETIPPVPPPVPPSGGGGTELPPVPDPVPPGPIVIPDGGTLVCNVQEDICNPLDAISQPANQQWNPTSDSDVPGPIIQLYWNDGLQTWYPKDRTVMTNSANKWPVNAIIGSAIRPAAPVITGYTQLGSTLSLSWTESLQCLPVTNFTVYNNDVPVQITDNNTFTATVALNPGQNDIYVVASNGTILSDSSVHILLFG